jgi:hypothetical protein
MARTKTIAKPESAKPTETTATGTTSYSVNASFCNICGGELPVTCTCCGGKLTKEKASEIHNKAAHPE